MEIRTMNLGQGLNWIGSGFGLFRRNPVTWILIILIFLAVMTLLSLVPFIGAMATTILQPVLIGGLMLGCRELDRGFDLRIEHLFAGFRQNTNPLLMIGVFTGLGYVLLGVVLMLVVGGSALTLSGFGPRLDDPTQFGIDTATGPVAMAVLVALLLAIPIAMATWFAPALVMFRDLSAWEALQQSFTGCLRNLWPFLAYGLALSVLAMLAVIPFGLGLLVLVPTLIGSVYAGYSDIFPEG